MLERFFIWRVFYLERRGSYISIYIKWLIKLVFVVMCLVRLIMCIKFFINFFVRWMYKLRKIILDFLEDFNYLIIGKLFFGMYRCICCRKKKCLVVYF